MKNLQSLLGVSREQAMQMVEPEYGAAQINQITDYTYLLYKDAGFSLLVEDGTVTSIHVYDGERDGFRAYRGQLPGEAGFQTGQDEMRGRLGEPIRSGKPGPGLLGAPNHWDLFDLGDYTLHAEYTSDRQRVTMFTLGRK